jgi:hypothetical protein
MRIHCSLPLAHLITATEVLPFEVILHLSTEAETAWNKVWARHSQMVYKEVGKRISGSTGHYPQGNSEGEHFSCDDEKEAMACRRVQTLSHYFFPTGIVVYLWKKFLSLW